MKAASVMGGQAVCIALWQHGAKGEKGKRGKGKNLVLFSSGTAHSLLNQITKDWHSRSVTLSEAKGLAVRFFAALRMTLLNDCVAECTNVMHFDLASPAHAKARQRGLRNAIIRSAYTDDHRVSL